MHRDKLYAYAERYINNEITLLLEAYLSTKGKGTKAKLKDKITEYEKELEDLKFLKLRDEVLK